MPRFGKPELRAFREKMQAKLDALGKEFGLALILGDKAYYGETMTVSIIASEKRADGKPPESEREAAFKKHATLFGFAADDLGREFTNRGGTFRIAGLNPNAHKMPVIGQRVSTGKMFKFTAEEVKAGFMTAEVKTAPPPVKAKRPDADIINDLRKVEAALSPENLHCDGEASMTWVRQEGARLRAKKAELISELGRTPTDRELFAHILD